MWNANLDFSCHSCNTRRRLLLFICAICTEGNFNKGCNTGDEGPVREYATIGSRTGRGWRRTLLDIELQFYSGSTGVLIDELGRYRIYKFPKEYPGFYSACADGPNVLWLCGTLDRIVRIDLLTGEWESFSTGADHRLVFQGMAFDSATKKLFVAASPYALSFDTVSKTTAKLYTGITQDNYMRYSFPCGDGTWGIVMETPDASIIRWDPRSETAISVPLPQADVANVPNMPGISDASGRWYFPGRGWYNGQIGTFDKTGPRPEREARWLSLRGGKAIGVTTVRSDVEVVEWDLSNGSVRHVALMPDYDSPVVACLVPTKAGKIVTVNMYGYFSRYDIATGVNELSVSLPVVAVQYVDNLIRIDIDRLLGTPFITQSFWEVNLVTGEGRNCGRAAPGSGQICKIWKIDNKVYMAAYTGGELMEYDPSKPTDFPNNPHVVADPPGGMRPVGAADDGQSIFYSSSAKYGMLGSVLTKYNTLTGLATYAINPLPDQKIMSLAYDKKSKLLLGATTFLADGNSTPPTSSTSYFARINPEDFSVDAEFEAPKGAIWNEIIGPLGGGKYLCHCEGATGTFPIGTDTKSEVWFVLDAKNMVAPSETELRPFPSGFQRIVATPRDGLFIIQINNSIELWDMAKVERVSVIEKDFTGYNFTVDSELIYLIYDKQIEIRQLTW